MFVVGVVVMIVLIIVVVCVCIYVKKCRKSMKFLDVKYDVVRESVVIEL